jgi:hypothetical protein
LTGAKTTARRKRFTVRSRTRTDTFISRRTREMRVTLEWFEVSRAALVGVSRNVEAIRKGLHNARPTRESDWHVHILGALGECAFAKATNRYWNGSVNTFKSGGDVGDAIQVRTRSQSYYDLIVRAEDRDSDVYVLVTGGPHDFVVRGWLLAGDAKKPQYHKDYGGYGEAFFVPQSDLLPIDLLMCKEC